MKAAFYETNGGPDVLRYGEIDPPVVEEFDVLVRVQAISLEGGDLINRRNTKPANAVHVVGYQAGGVVERVGPGVKRFSPGDRVAAFHWFGSHAELFCVPQEHVFAIPDALDIRVGSTVPVTFGTAHDALFDAGQLQSGQTVLIQGAAGGVGLAMVQLAKQAGATVIGTASDGERLERLREYGLDHGIGYRTEDIAERALALTGGEGVDLVVDLAGGKGLSALLQSVRYRGRFVVIGAATGERQTLTFADIVPRALTVVGCLFGKEMYSQRAHLLVEEMFDGVAAGRLRMPIDRVFSLRDAAAAHRHAEEGHPFGRIIIEP